VCKSLAGARTAEEYVKLGDYNIQLGLEKHSEREIWRRERTAAQIMQQRVEPFVNLQIKAAAVVAEANFLRAALDIMFEI
jgi:hypothetical protein